MQDKTIILFAVSKYKSPSDSSGGITSIASLARCLALKNTVIFVEPADWCQNFIQKNNILRYLKEIFNVRVDERHENLIVIKTPSYLPLSIANIFLKYSKTAKAFLLKFNKLIHVALIRKKLNKLKHYPKILFCNNSLDLFAIGKFGELVSCAMITDEQALLPEFEFISDLIDKIELEHLCRTDIVFTTSTSQLEKRKENHERVFLVPNAVDFDLFENMNAARISEPEEMSNVPLPRIGYVGSIDLRIDNELLMFIAKRRPDWSIVMVGGFSNYIDKLAYRLKDLPNVYLTNRKKYEEIPGYLSSFNIGIIPFKLNKETRSMNPLKMYEYLASGLPIVSTDLPETRKFKSTIRIAKNQHEFVEMIEKELKTDNSVKIKERLKIASRNCWKERIKQISELIDAYIKEKDPIWERKS